MIRALDIQESLLHLVGWKQHYDTSELKISEALTESESGMYFQQIHPLLTLENLNCIAPDFQNIEYPEYDPDVEYDAGVIVEYLGLKYKSLQKVQGITPDANKEYWTETNLFSEWLEDKTKGSIQKAIIRFATDKTNQGKFTNLCEHKVLFDGTGRICDTVQNQNNLVGFEIVPIRSMGVTVKLEKIGLQFTEPGEYNIYIMHSSMNVPVYSLTFTKYRTNSMEWFALDDVYLPYMGTDNDAGGSWYLCYFQSDLPEGSQAIRKERDWSKGPCRGCSRREYLSWQAWSKFLEIHPFYVNSELVDAVSFDDDFNDDFAKVRLHMWDIENNMPTYDTNYGINLEVTVFCDVTDFIIEQKSLFQDVISKQVAIDFLREFAYNANVRTNRHSINASRTDILYEIDGDSSSMKKSGLAYQLDQAFKAIELTTDGIDRICMPCRNNGIKYRSI